MASKRNSKDLKVNWSARVRLCNTGYRGRSEVGTNISNTRIKVYENTLDDTIRTYKGTKKYC